MTDSNPKTKGSNSTPNNQNEQTKQQNNTTNSFKKEFLNPDSAELRLDALKTAFQNQKNGEEEISGPALAGIIDTPVAEKEKVKEKVKKPEPKDKKISNLESDGWTSNMPDKTF
jgi:hypothetical protein|tara:strand:+ start:223 stop:564 length:342 start_codon:yes stop_codon:yes gene_type:complete